MYGAMGPAGIQRRFNHVLLAATTLAGGVACAERTADDPAGTFWNELRTLCGRSFTGSPTEVSVLDSAIVGEILVLNVWQCWNEEVRLAFHVGDDHSRVWVVSMDGDGLHLNHAVHAATGEPASFTNYGGAALGPGTAQMQTFEPDPETLVRFPSAAGSRWTLEFAPGERRSYTYTADDGARRFRVDFDLRSSAPRPPSPWGWTRPSQPQAADPR